MAEYPRTVLQLFLRLMQQAVDLSPIPAKEILGGP
jgi:hypothetical protein